MGLKINGSTDGSIEVDVPASCGSDLSVTLPATAGDIVVKGTDGSVDLGAIDIAASAPADSVNLDSSGRLLLGSTSPIRSTALDNSLHLTSPNGPELYFLRDDASTVEGNALGMLRFYSNDNDGTAQEAARIECDAALDHGNDDKPSRLLFFTTSDAGNSPNVRLQIDHRGQHIFCANAIPSTSHLFLTARGSSSSVRLVSFRHSAPEGTTPGAGTEVCVVRTNGDLDNTNNSYGSLSDIKLKENIVDANSQWDDIKNLQIRNYNFKAETGNETYTQIGLIAQEAELVCPGLVKETFDTDGSGDELDTTTKHIKYSVLYMKAVKALQEAMERIETLEASNAALETRLTALEGGAS
jgi:hypothetical protein